MRLFTALVLATELIACSSGGGSGGGGASIPSLSWPRARRGDTNQAIGVATLAGNQATSTALLEQGAAGDCGFNGSPAPPTIGRDGIVYLAATDALISIEPSGDCRWRLDECVLENEIISLGSVATSPAISADGRDLILGSDTHVFLLREAEEGNDLPACLFAFPVGSRSSALPVVEGFDFRLLWFATGTDSGRLTAINVDGLRRWSFPDVAFDSPVTGTPAAFNGGFVFVGPDGVLYNVDPSGRLRWSERIGEPYSDASPVSAAPAAVILNDIYALSAAGEIVAVSPNGNRVWTYASSDDSPIIADLIASPLTTSGAGNLRENVIFAVDESGTLHGVGSETGELVRFCDSRNEACRPSTCPGEAECTEVQFCSDAQETIVCSSDDDCPQGSQGSCTGGTRCSESMRRCSSDEECEMANEGICGNFFCANATSTACIRDTCFTNDDDSSRCTRPALHPLDSDVELDVTAAPVLATDSFVVAATADGRVCARRLDGTVPMGSCGDEAMTSCTPDSCASGDTCCTDAATCTLGFCAGDPLRPCTPDTCTAETNGECTSPWQHGCIELGETTGGAVAVLLDDSTGIDDHILLAAEKGLFEIK